jgi:branched-subunit amino acid aminotransferase/4-amino-4-deoxychorismate lyase
MSAQGDVSHGTAEDFGLIETLLWTEDEGFSLLDEHLARLTSSAAALGFACDKGAVADALDAAVHAPSTPRQRARLVLDRTGHCAVTAAAVENLPAGTVWRVAVARTHFNSSDRLLRHKTTRRDLYESELAEAVAQCSADEVVFFNERDELCEGARSNVFVEADGLLLTPPLASGLLPGTLRARLLAEGRAREALLRLPDLSDEALWYMGNSVRGLVPAHLATLTAALRAPG